MDSPPQIDREAEALAKTPSALLKRNMLVQLEGGGQVVVQKWSVEKTFAILDYLVSVIRGMSDEALSKINVGGGVQSATAVWSILGGKVLGIIELSVSPEDRPKLNPKEITAMDLLNLIDAVMKVNITEEFVKKAVEVVGETKRLSALRGGVIPSKAPTASSAGQG